VVKVKVAGQAAKSIVVGILEERVKVKVLQGCLGTEIEITEIE
jgi:hypothetical protein